jgi:hypothetical protein
MANDRMNLIGRRDDNHREDYGLPSVIRSQSLGQFLLGPSRSNRPRHDRN